MAELFLCFGESCFSPVASFEMCSWLSQTPTARSAALGMWPERLQLFRQMKKRTETLSFLPSLSLLLYPCQLTSTGNSIRRHREASWCLRKVMLAASRMAPGSAGDQMVEEQLR